MAVKTIEIRVCDKCNKNLVGRLTYRKCPCCGGEVCLACIDKANAKEKPKEKKLKEKPTTAPPEETDSITPEEAKGVDISTFKTKVGQDGKDHEVSMGGVGIVCGNLKKGCQDLLLALNIDQAYVENAPDSDGKKLLLSILQEE